MKVNCRASKLSIIVSSILFVMSIIFEILDINYSNDQFDKAIRTCDYNVAWSNPNFELWILSHLKRVTKYISNDDILKELDKEFQKNGLGEYKKNDEKIFEKVTSDGKIHMAIDNCKLMEKINENGQASQRNPMTQVYKVVEGLKEYLE